MTEQSRTTPGHLRASDVGPAGEPPPRDPAQVADAPNRGRLANQTESFVTGVLSNLVSAALIYLILNATGFLTQHKGRTVTTAVAFLVVAWGCYGYLLAQDMSSAGVDGAPAKMRTATALASVVALAALVVEIVVLSRHNPWYTTTWITAASIVIASIPMVLGHRLRNGDSDSAAASRT